MTAPSRTPRHHRLALALFASLAASSASPVWAQAAPTASAATTTANPASRALHALFDAQWEALAQRFPEFATYRGDHRFNDRLADVSQAAQDEADRLTADWLAQARRIPRADLNATDRVSLDMFIAMLERQQSLQAFPGYRTLRIGALGGPQSDLAGLLLVVPVANTTQVEQLLTRLAAVPRRMDQELATLRKGLGLGFVSSRDVLQRVLGQIDSQLAMPLEASPYYAPFKRLGAGINEADRTRLQAAGRQAVEQQVLPSLRRLRDFIANDYLPKAPANGALKNYPDGERLYDLVVRQQTTTNLSAAEVHAIGLRELTRLRGEMEAVMKGTGFQGDFAAFVKYLNTDPKFFHTSPEALLAGCRDIAKRFDAELPRFFAELPRAPYGIRPMPAFRGPDAAEYYDGPARDGTRAGYFNANTLGFKTRPIWGMATLVAHEAAPGHHLQIARNTELGQLPEFRRSSFGYTAYVEGWALYAETLGGPMGLYDDPYSRFGHLQWQAFRAARLVVDTGIHKLGWGRQQAIAFMVERTGVDVGFVTSEVDRYTSTPGQALAYMIGQLKIVELRDRAQKKLGAKFDIRRFHNAVLDNGALPLDLLDKLVDEWINAQAAG